VEPEGRKGKQEAVFLFCKKKRRPSRREENNPLASVREREGGGLSKTNYLKRKSLEKKKEEGGKAIYLRAVRGENIHSSPFALSGGGGKSLFGERGKRVFLHTTCPYKGRTSLLPVPPPMRERGGNFEGRERFSDESGREIPPIGQKVE